MYLGRTDTRNACRGGEGFPSLFAQLRGLITAVFIVVLIVAPGALAGSAQANPSTRSVTQLTEDAERARADLDELAAKLELATEDYYAARAELDDANERVAQTRAELESVEVELLGAQSRMNERATAIYRAGDFVLLDVLMGATDFRSFVSSLDFMRRVNETDAQLVADVRALRNRLVTTEQKLSQEQAQARSAAAKAKDAHEAARSALAQQERYIESVDAQLERAIQEERERLEAEARRRAAQRAAARSSEDASPVRGGRTSDESTLGAPRSEVVQIARRFVGVTPYVWGGSSPSGFDCSGLTWYCYREIGVAIPRTSRTQYTVGKFIPADRTDLLQPGDLLFFGYNRDPSRVHHVAIYSGNGMMIHAPQTGMKVSETSLSARSDFVGATRP